MPTPDQAPVRNEQQRPGWAPADIDLCQPNVARVYDYYLGGAHNFTADRAMAHEAIRSWPELPMIMRANRAFLNRVVRFLLDAGVRQFLDLGSGIPTVGNVHEIAQSVDPTSRVAYVDIDPVAVGHSRAMLEGNERATAVLGDLRLPAAVLGDQQVGELLDFSQPVAVLLVAVLHFVPDADNPTAIIADYCDAIAPGSYVVICHATHEGNAERAETHRRLYARTRTAMTTRTRADVGAMLNGLDLLEPGVVRMPLWRPDPSETPTEEPERFAGYAAVARKS